MKAHKSRRVFPSAVSWGPNCRREGQILIMTVLGISVLAGMAFYVYNTGQQVNDRVAMQSAADSAAASGTVQLARGMNVVAMNNISMAKLMATVVVLDSVPLATNMSLAEATAFQACIQAQLVALPAISAKIPDPREQAILNAALPVLNNRLTTEVNILTPVDETLNPIDPKNGFNMAATTNWSVVGQDGSPGQGTLWQGIVALGQFNNATKASWGVLAQQNAVRFGQSDKADLAFMAPVLPAMPAYLGAFTDFEPLLRGSENVGSNIASASRKGGPGGAIPEMVMQDAQHQGPPYYSPSSGPPYPWRLGPYARLFRPLPSAPPKIHDPCLPWQNPRWRIIGGSAIPASGNMGGIPGDGGVGSSGPGFGGGWQGGTGILTGYSTNGPVRWALNNLSWWTNGNGSANFFGNLPDTHFWQYMSQLTNFKLEYMFGSQAIQKIHKPKIIPNYDDAKNAAANPKTPAYRTYYFCIRIISSVPEGDGAWLQPNTCWTNVPGFGYQQNVTPVFTGFGGWLDMQKFVGRPAPQPRPGRRVPGVWTRLGNYIWKETATGTSTLWPQIGIYQKLDGNGQPVQQPIYFVEFRIFGGLDIGPMVDVSNPCNWTNSEVLPQPMLLDTSKGDYDPNNPNADAGVRRKLFSFLGVARHTATSNFWQQQFQPANPSGNMVTVAQAELFNNSSWDLWTQDWRAQLVPVTQWDDWTAQMAAGAGDASATNGALQPNDVTTVAEYLKRLNAKMVEAYVHH